MSTYNVLNFEGNYILNDFFSDSYYPYTYRGDFVSNFLLMLLGSIFWNSLFLLPRMFLVQCNPWMLRQCPLNTHRDALYQVDGRSLKIKELLLLGGAFFIINSTTDKLNNTDLFISKQIKTSIFFFKSPTFLHYSYFCKISVIEICRLKGKFHQYLSFYT